MRLDWDRDFTKSLFHGTSENVTLCAIRLQRHHSMFIPHVIEPVDPLLNTLRSAGLYYGLFAHHDLQHNLTLILQRSCMKKP